jgi:hypothetical protein
MSDKVYIDTYDKRIETKGEVLEQILKDQAEVQESHRLIKAEQTAKAEASAIAKLAALGLSEEEISSLIGGV